MGNIFSNNIPMSVATIIGFFGVIAAYRLGRHRDRKQNFSAAYSELTSIFTPAIAKIDAAILFTGDQDAPDVNGFLSDNFEAYVAAIQNFLPFITRRRKRKAYQKAWQEYCDLEPSGGGITLFAGSAVQHNGNHLEFIKNKIENILKTAERC